MSIQNLIDQVNEQTYSHVEDKMKYVKASELGLDSRCGMVYVDSDCIAVTQNSDRSLQYYGGFEYVDKEYRTEMGGYVFYFRDDDRVNGHLETFEESQVAAE